MDTEFVFILFCSMSYYIMYRRRPAGEYRRPPLLGLFRERSKRKLENLYLNMQTLKQNLDETRFENHKKSLKNSWKIFKNQGLEGVRRGSGSSWGRPWDEKSTKSCLGRFWSILAGLGSTKISPKWFQMGPGQNR